MYKSARTHCETAIPLVLAMLFKILLLSSFLLASAALVLAAPSSRHGARVARRREGRQSQLNNRLEHPTGAAGVSDGSYSTNWAGAVWDEVKVRRQPHGSCLTLISSYFVRTGNFHFSYWYFHHSHSLGSKRLCCRCLGRYRR